MLHAHVLYDVHCQLPFSVTACVNEAVDQTFSLVNAGLIPKDENVMAFLLV